MILSFRRWSRVLIAYILALLIIPSVLFSQEKLQPATQLPHGSQLKIITVEDNKRKEIIGTVVNWISDSVELTGKNDISRSIGINEIQKVYVRDGKRRHWKKGLIIGAAAGAAIWLINPVEGKDNPWQGLDILNNIGLTVWSTGIGTLIGALIKTDKWKETEVNAGVSISR